MHRERENGRRLYLIDGTELTSTTRASDLGVIITRDFNFSEQTREAANKAARQMLMFRVVQGLCSVSSNVLFTSVETEDGKRQKTTPIGIRPLWT